MSGQVHTAEAPRRRVRGMPALDHFFTIHLSDDELTLLASFLAERRSWKNIEHRMGYSYSVLMRHARLYNLLPPGRKPRNSDRASGWHVPEIRAARLEAMARRNQRPPNPGFVWSDELDVALCLMIAAGFAAPDIAKRIGVSWRVCRTRARAIGFLTGRKSRASGKRSL